MKQMKFKLVIVVRDDLKLSPGKLAVQAAHAAVTCSLKCKKGNARWFRSWYEEGQKKVVVKVKGLEELHESKELAENKGLTTSMVIDAGLTELPAGTITCLGVGPGPNEIVDKVTGDLILL